MSRRQKDLFPELPDGKLYVSDIPELVEEWYGKRPCINRSLFRVSFSSCSGPDHNANH